MVLTIQLIAVSAILITLYTVNGQMIRQCQCSETERCKKNHENLIIPCADQCQHLVVSMGANYPKLKQCILAQQTKIRATFKCTEALHLNACSRGTSRTVPKRYPENLKIAALNKINQMLTQSGIQTEARSFLTTGNKFYSCMKNCFEKKTGFCFKKLNCGLSLPSDNVLVENAKTCAIQSGFDNNTVKQTCHCAASAGVRGLSRICNKIVI